jgi:serine/threonine-protein kinase RsbW
MPLLHLDLEQAPESVSRARRAVRAFVLEVWPAEPVAADLADDAELVTSELVANAVRHGATPVTIDVDADDEDGHHVVRIVSHDGGPWDGTDPSPLGGRGLTIVRQLSVDVAIDADAFGTTVVSVLQR